MPGNDALAQAATLAEARPITATRAVGQQVKSDWDITVINPYELAKFHPDLVNITPRLADIKAALNEGREIKGIKAVRETTPGVSLPPAQKVIDV